MEPKLIIQIIVSTAIVWGCYQVRILYKGILDAANKKD